MSNDQFRVKYFVHPSSDDGHRYKLKMTIWDENENYYDTIEIREYATIDRAVEVMHYLTAAQYECEGKYPWE